MIQKDTEKMRSASTNETIKATIRRAISRDSRAASS